MEFIASKSGLEVEIVNFLTVLDPLEIFRDDEFCFWPNFVGVETSGTVAVDCFPLMVLPSEESDRRLISLPRVKYCEI